jgi:hypothetical protein
MVDIKDYKTCDDPAGRGCDRPARVNVQKLWLRWEYNPIADDYSREFEILDVPPDDNWHLCLECEEEMFGEHREGIKYDRSKDGG